MSRQKVHIDFCMAVLRGIRFWVRVTGRTRSPLYFTLLVTDAPPQNGGFMSMFVCVVCFKFWKEQSWQ
jgi:hypothetical protein